MNTEAFNKLVEILESPLPKNTIFNMSEFGRNMGDYCRYCAAGFAGLNPWFIERGFLTVPNGEFLYEVVFKNEYYMNAIVKFFEIDHKDAIKLFHSVSYNDASQEKVLERIKEYIKNNTFKE